MYYSSPIKLVYIVGHGRSGSTLLDTMLNCSENTIGVGQLSTAAEDHITGCSCGAKSIDKCEFWSRVLTLYEKKTGDINKQRLKTLEKEFDDNRRLLSIFIRWYKKEDYSEYLSLTRSQLEAIQEISEKPIIVDSSKQISRLLSISNVDGIEIVVIHLIRDGRGVLWSRVPRKIRDAFVTGEQVKIMPTFKNLYFGARRWSRVNLAVVLLRCIRQLTDVYTIKYEDIMENPIKQLKRIGDVTGIEPHSILKVFDEKSSFTLGHFLAGNPEIKTSGPIRINPALHEKWRYAFPLSTFLFFYILTLPVNLLFRYPFIGPRSKE